MKALVVSLMLLACPAYAGLPGPVASPAPASPVVAVAEPAAPPAWAQDLMVKLETIPVVGPVVTKALVYLGIGVSLLTSLIAALLGLINAASGILNIAGVAGLADKLQAFKDGKIMYWLKYLSMFNAKPATPATPTGVISA